MEPADAGAAGGSQGAPGPGEPGLLPGVTAEVGAGRAAPDQAVPTRNISPRVIVHVDLDCFYAQVEMISNPELKNKPLGVQQKSFVITCNYEARKLGIKKCMKVRDAKEKCPQLILVNGEDLTRYREMSYKVTELLGEFTPLVERLGFDENFVDLTEMVEKRLQQLQSDELPAVTVSGHVYSNKCIGYKTAKCLEALGIHSVHDLQTFSSKILEKQLGISVAQHIQKLSFGEDNSSVIPSGPPQSFSEEDSFKKCSSEVEAKKKIEELLAILLNRVCQDGRKPHTVRLAIRRSSSKYYSRESRQCPIPAHVIQKLGTGSCDVMTPLVNILMKLFRNMINVKMPFHLTLLSVCFCNLKALNIAKKGLMDYYLTPSLSATSHSGKHSFKMKDAYMEDFSKDKEANCDFLTMGRIASMRTEVSSPDSTNFSREEDVNGSPHYSLPEDVDEEVFKQLPADIQEEILSEKSKEKFQANEKLSCPLRTSRGVLSFFSTKQIQNTPLNPRDNLSNCKQVSAVSPCEAGTSGLNSSSSCLSSPKEYSYCIDNGLRMSQGPKESQGFHFPSTNPVFHSFPNVPSEQLFSKNHTTDSHEQTPTGSHQGLIESREQGSAEEKISFPPDVDPQVFYELPEEVQKELLAEWKRAG
ncbi:PREDICTED: DNA polymerase iota isoform X2 [Chinchilla lanigera]|uniref:DNA polymerase iota isoform X2 n=1 Tax=Chinchilla lanigera TaxID=34839 RepID=UPI000698F531|nr:PREDICTED: DNA polymerase iota isoform X2 [Chinchilla lanigera]